MTSGLLLLRHVLTSQVSSNEVSHISVHIETMDVFDTVGFYCLPACAFIRQKDFMDQVAWS